MVEQPRFRAAYDFLLLRAAAGEIDQELADWWTNFIESDPDIRQELINQRQRAQLKHGGGGRGATQAVGGDVRVADGAANGATTVIVTAAAAKSGGERD